MQPDIDTVVDMVSQQTAEGPADATGTPPRGGYSLGDLRRPEQYTKDGDCDVNRYFVVRTAMMKHREPNEEMGADDYLGHGEFSTHSLELPAFLHKECGWSLEDAMMFNAECCQDCANIITAFAEGGYFPPDQWSHTQCDWCCPIKKNWDNLSESLVVFGRMDTLVESVVNEQVYDYSSTQVNLPANVSQLFREFSGGIPDDDIYTDPNDDSYGRESDPHVTVKYGLHTADPEEVKELLKDELSFKVRLGKTDKFDSSDGYQVLIVTAEGDGLRALNKKISNGLEVTDTYPKYNPHATLCYMKPGKADQYVGRNDFDGTVVHVDEIVMSSKDGKTYTVPLSKAKQ
jgi:hypothetical protein